jgi:redox-sensitive bicupin YhaK (pirin superfamily)
MMDPRYQDVYAKDIPEAKPQDGVSIRVICGEVNGLKGPVKDIVIDPEYLDITVEAGTEYLHPTKKGYTAFVYTIGGNGSTGPGGEAGEQGSGENIENGTLVLFNDGDQVRIKAGSEPLRCLFISGKPLKEPISWGGPIVMNTKEELNQAFQEFRSGNFIKK